MGAVPVASQVALVVKNTPASAGDLRDLGSIPGSGLIPGLGQSLGDGHWNPLMGLNPLIGTHHVHGLSMPIIIQILSACLDIYRTCVCMCECVCLVTQSCLTFCNPIACQATLSMGILQARILQWVVMPSFRGSSQPRDQTLVSHISGRLFTS